MDNLEISIDIGGFALLGDAPADGLLAKLWFERLKKRGEFDGNYGRRLPFLELDEEGFYRVSRMHYTVVGVDNRTLFTGIDLSGKYLEGLFVGKLPFEPIEPKSDYFTRRRYGSFSSQADMVKKALMTFRQGLGRAIRSETDRAVVLVADPRIKSARYGEFLYFLESAGIEIAADLLKAS